jgi:hypothetical protein
MGTTAFDTNITPLQNCKTIRQLNGSRDEDINGTVVEGHGTIVHSWVRKEYEWISGSKAIQAQMKCK